MPAPGRAPCPGQGGKRATEARTMPPVAGSIGEPRRPRCSRLRSRERMHGPFRGSRPLRRTRRHRGDGFAPHERADADAFAAYLGRRHAARIAGSLVVPERQARHADFPMSLDPRLVGALRERGVGRLYSHQREAWDHVAAGRDVVVVTPTASGKTLCYNLPVLQAALRRPREGALSVSDQGAGAGPGRRTAGDQSRRQSRRARLHLRRRHARRRPPRGAHPRRHRRHQPRHAARGHPAASHQVGAVLREPALRGDRRAAHLSRRVRFARRQPACGASIASAASTACGRPSSCARPPSPIRANSPRACSARRSRRSPESGAPSGRKHLLVWNPPVVNPDLGLRASARSQSTRLARIAVKLGLKTIVFTNSRLEVEVLTKYLKDVFDADPRKPAARGRLPRRLPAHRAARQGSQAARRPHRLRRLHVGAGTRRRHRRARRLRAQRVSGLGRRGAAALRPRRPAQSRRGRRAGLLQRPARPVPRAQSRLLPRRESRACAHRPATAAHPHGSRPLRRVRVAVRGWRDVRRPGPPTKRWHGSPSRASCIARARAGTGSPTAIPRSR